MLRLTRPKVSFVIPAWNQERFLAYAVGSALAQSLREIEVVVIDDASTDATGAILEAIDDPRLCVIRSPENLGPGGARNLGLEAADAPIVAFLDADDVAAPERAQSQLDFFEAHPDHVLVGSAYGVIDADDNLLGAERPVEYEDEALAFTTLFLSPVHLTTSAVRADAIKRNAIRFPTDSRIVEDYRFVSSLVRCGKVANLPDILTYYRRHDAMTSRLFQSEGWRQFAQASAENIRCLGVECEAELAAMLTQIHLSWMRGDAGGDLQLRDIHAKLRELHSMRSRP